MVKRDRDLNQSLQKLLLGSGGGPPDVFKDFMGVEKCSLVEELKTQIVIGIH